MAYSFHLQIAAVLQRHPAPPEEVAQRQRGSECVGECREFFHFEDDKSEALSTQMAVPFLGFLAAIENHSHGERVGFRLRPLPSEVPLTW